MKKLLTIAAVLLFVCTGCQTQPPKRESYWTTVRYRLADDMYRAADWLDRR